MKILISVPSADGLAPWEKPAKHRSAISAGGTGVLSSIITNPADRKFGQQGYDFYFCQYNYS